MASCSAGGPDGCSCECKNGCACILTEGVCACRCFGGLRPPNFGVFAGVNALTRIDLTIRGARGSEVAVALSRALRVDLAVPTKLLEKRLNVRLKNTTIRKVIKHLGFIETRKRSL